MQESCIDYYDEYIGMDIHGCCLICPDAEDGCLCYDCKCTKCYWYEPEEGYCELVDYFKQEREEKRNKYSNKKIRNIIKCTEKAVYGQIEFSDLMWIPKSVFNKDGFVKQWFVDKI